MTHTQPAALTAAQASRAEMADDVITVAMLGMPRDIQLSFRAVTLETEDKNEMDTQALINEAFRLGQNDFQPQEMRSVSVGDCVFAPDGTIWLVKGCGFEELDHNQWGDYSRMTASDRFSRAHF